MTWSKFIYVQSTENLKYIPIQNKTASSLPGFKVLIKNAMGTPIWDPRIHYLMYYDILLI